MNRWSTFALVAVIWIGCGSDSDQVALDADALEVVREYAMGPDTNTQSVVILKDGDLVAEWYAPDRAFVSTTL